MDPVVLVHLSDIHFHAGDTGLAARMKAVRTHLVADLAKMRAMIGDATAVVVTGDIAFSGETSQYEVAQTWLAEVSRSVGSQEAAVLTIPGNHDVHWPSITPSARIARESLRNCDLSEVSRSIDELIDDPSRPLLRALDNYNEFAVGYRCEVPEDGLPWKARLPLPRGYNLAFRGLTTVFNSDRNDGNATLVVGQTQTSLPLDDPSAIHVLLAHHGPDDCREATDIRDRMLHKVRALLCGHRHDQRVKTVDGCVEITAGAVHPEEQVGFYPTYNWIKFDVVDTPSGKNALRIQEWQRVMRPAWNRFGSGDEGPEPRSEEFFLPDLPDPETPPSKPEAATFSTPLAARAANSLEYDRQNIEGVSVRPPITDEAGRVDERRRIARDLLDLPAPDQRRILAECGLLSNDDLRQDHGTMIIGALNKANRPEILTMLADAVQKAHQEGRS